MKLQILPNDVTARTGFTHQIILTHADLTETTANTAQTLALISVKAGQVVFRAAYALPVPFKNSTDAAFNSNLITVGDGGDVDRLLASSQINENGTEVLYAVHVPTTVSYVFTVDDTIDIVVGSMAAKALNDLDTGELHIFLGIVDLGRLAALADH